MTCKMMTRKEKELFKGFFLKLLELGHFTDKDTMMELQSKLLS